MGKGSCMKTLAKQNLLGMKNIILEIVGVEVGSEVELAVEN
jgi:hypothetical protein